MLQWQRTMRCLFTFSLVSAVISNASLICAPKAVHVLLWINNITIFKNTVVLVVVMWSTASLSVVIEHATESNKQSITNRKQEPWLSQYTGYPTICRLKHEWRLQCESNILNRDTTVACSLDFNALKSKSSARNITCGKNWAIRSYFFSKKNPKHKIQFISLLVGSSESKRNRIDYFTISRSCSPLWKMGS